MFFVSSMWLDYSRIFLLYLNVFTFSVFGFLKWISLWINHPMLENPHAVFHGITERKFLLVAVIFDFLTAAVLAVHSSENVRTVVCVLVFACLTGYRGIFYFMNDWKTPCSCLGHVAEWTGLSTNQLNGLSLMGYAVVALFFIANLLWQRKRSEGSME